MPENTIKVLKTLFFKKRHEDIHILEYLSLNKELVNRLHKRRSALMRNMLLLKKQYLMLLTISKDLKTQPRLCWTKERTQSFWEVDCQVNDDEFFKINFRMSRSSFLELCGILRSLERKDTVFRKAITLHKRVAIALYALGSSAEYRTIGNIFGVGKSTVYGILFDFCNDAWKILRPRYFNYFPLTEEIISEFVDGFEAIDFPQCMGVIDGCHIEFHPSYKDAKDYYNCDGWYSTVLMALVDASSRFIYINVGSPGSCNVAEIYESSTLKEQLEECPFLSEMTRRISGVNVPVFIVGCSDFPFNNKLMKPYPYRIKQNVKEKAFNNAVAKTESVAESAFEHLKARFRRIGKGITSTIGNANAVIKACCALHNFLNDKNDTLNKEWMDDLKNVEKNRTYTTHDIYENFNQKNRAETIRNALANYFSSREDFNGSGVSRYSVDSAQLSES